MFNAGSLVRPGRMPVLMLVLAAAMLGPVVIGILVMVVLLVRKQAGMP